MNKNVNDLYRLQDGTQADPTDVKKGDDGVWRHKNGLTVALNDKGEPQTIGEASAATGNDPKAKDEPPKTEEKPKTEPPAIPERQTTR